MTAPCGEYGDRLLLFVAGRLPAEEAEAMRRHLAFCPPCAAEAALVGEVVRDLGRSAPGHPLPPEMVRYHDRLLPAERVREVDAHLAGCASCRSDLSALRDAERRERRLRRGASLRGFRAAAAAAAVVVVAGLAGWWAIEGQKTDGASRTVTTTSSPATLEPAKRQGGRAAPRPVGPGPVSVLLPVLAPSTPFRATLEVREGGIPRLLHERLLPDRAGWVVVHVPPDTPAGEYVLRLTAVGGDGSESHAYPLTVETSR